MKSLHAGLRNRMKVAYLLILLLAFAAISGCANVYSKQPTGETPAELSAWPSWAKDKLTSGEWAGTNYIRSLVFTEDNGFTIAFNSGNPLAGTYKLLNVSSSSNMHEMIMKLSSTGLIIHAWINFKAKDYILFAWNNQRSITELKLVKLN